MEPERSSGFTKNISVLLNGSSTSSNSRYFCRICHDDGELISPCKCTGSMGLMHLECLEKWLSTNNLNACEICGHAFQVVKTCKPFREFVLSNSAQAGENRRYILCDFITFLLLTPLLVFAFTMCIMGAVHYLQIRSQSEANCLLCLATFLILVYIFWIYLLYMHHRCQYKEWKKQNVMIKLMAINGELINAPAAAVDPIRILDP